MQLENVKIVLFIFYVVLFALFAFNNTFDFNADYAFVQHVLSMDTTFSPNSARAITDPAVWYAAYFLIILWQWVTALVGIIGCYQYMCFKKITCINLSLLMGITLYFAGFLCIASEWFLMWQSSMWNGQGTALNFTLLFILLFIVVNLPEIMKDKM